MEDKYRMLASRYEKLMEKQSKQENYVNELRTANQELRTKLTMTSLELSSRTDDSEELKHYCPVISEFGSSAENGRPDRSSKWRTLPVITLGRCAT